MINISYRSIENSDKNLINKFIVKHWGSEKVVVHSTEYFPANLPGYIAQYGNLIVGLITFKFLEISCEIITINSEIEKFGIGSELIKLVEKETRKNNIDTIWLITTNDNIKAIEFYQKRGFQLVEVYPNAVIESRKLKPDIPIFAENGIPIRDELKFNKRLK